MSFDWNEEDRIAGIKKSALINQLDLQKNLDNIAATLGTLQAAQLQAAAWATELTTAGRTEDAAVVAGLVPGLQDAVVDAVNVNKIASAVAGVRALSGDHASLLGMALVDTKGDAIPAA